MTASAMLPTASTTMVAACWPSVGWLLVAALSMTPIGITQARSSTDAVQARLEQCRDGCLKKFATDDISCLQAPECSTCWDDCSAATTVNRAVPATWPLSVTSMVRDGSLVSANVAWHAEPLAPKAPSDCLVTWEVSGGGLIGNLLTQTTFVELSLWPDTKYRVQVTCKSKNTEDISRSVPLTLDTSAALVIVRIPTITPPPLSTLQHIRRASDETADAVDPSDRYATTYMLFDAAPKRTATTALLSWTSDMYASVSVDFLFACAAAIVVFAVVLAAYVVSWRKTRRSAAALVDKTPLVDNEVSVHVDADRLTIHV